MLSKTCLRSCLRPVSRFGVRNKPLALESKRQCTDILVMTEPGMPGASTAVHGRTMEFGADVGAVITATPAGNEFDFLSPFGRDVPGLKCENKFSYYNMEGTLKMTDPDTGKEVTLLQEAVDGANEKGLTVGALYLPGFAKFQEVSNPKDASKCIWNAKVVDYLLGNFESVEEIEEAMENVYVWDLSSPMGIDKTVLTVHYVAYDRLGRGKVIEYVNGKLQISDSIGVFTNSPPYGYHVDNVKTYDGLVTENPAGWEIGQGYGLIGLPGDWSAPSRFIRTYIQRKFMTAKQTREEAVNSVAHVINSVDIMKGIAMENGVSDITQWAVIKDIGSNKMYYRLYDSLNWGVVDLDFAQLSQMEGQAPKQIVLPQNNDPNAVDVLASKTNKPQTDLSSIKLGQNLKL